MSKKFQDLDLCNAFLFAVALEDPETCRLILEIILGHSIPEVVVHTEHNIMLNTEFKSVRLDVYARDGLHVNYDMEAQNDDEKNLPKRSRYYQAELDASTLKPGEDYNKLEPSYIIFICTFDPFGKGLYCYTFEERCLECDISLGDGTKKIFLNTKGKNAAEVSAELVHFLGYMEQSTDKYVENIPENSIRRIHGRVQEIKQWRKMEERYMTMEELVQDRERKSHREGLAEGLVSAVLDLLSDMGSVPEALEAQIKSERNPDTLRNWNKVAAKSDSIEEFISKIQ